MTPELEAALWWASASEDERWEKCGLDKLEWCSTLANAKYGMLNKAAWAEIAGYVRRREAMSCKTCMFCMTDYLCRRSGFSLDDNTMRYYGCETWGETCGAWRAKS